MTVLAVLVGATLALWLCTAAATAFVLYHFVYKSWKVMRTDMHALNTKVDASLQLLNRERVMSLTDEEVAFREQRSQARQRERVRG